MAALKEESKLFKELSDLYDNNKKEITLNIYKEAIKTARKYDKDEIQFVLFKLRYNNKSFKTGIAELDKRTTPIAHFFRILFRKDYKLEFIYSVLEAI